MPRGCRASEGSAPPPWPLELSEQEQGWGGEQPPPACLLMDPLGFPIASSEKSSQSQGFPLSQALLSHSHSLEWTQKTTSCTLLAAAPGLSSTATAPSQQRTSSPRGDGWHFLSRLVLGGFFSQLDFCQDVEAQYTEAASAKLPTSPSSTGKRPKLTKRVC